MLLGLAMFALKQVINFNTFAKKLVNPAGKISILEFYECIRKPESLHLLSGLIEYTCC